MTLSLAGRLLDQPSPARAVPWPEFVKARVDLEWRPNEFDGATLLFVPSVTNRDNSISVCRRDGCEIRPAGHYCAGCRGQHERSGSALPIDEWAKISGPRLKVHYEQHCIVDSCQRTRVRRELCIAHVHTFARWQVANEGTVRDWIVAKSPTGLPSKAKCVLNCGRDSLNGGVCARHTTTFRAWQKRQESRSTATLAEWLRSTAEPTFGPTDRSYRELVATPFALLNEPLRWELLYAVQRREQAGWFINPYFLRSAYRHHRRLGTETAVGLDRLGLENSPKGKNSLYANFQLCIDDLYREWSGVDDRDPRVVYFRDLEMRQASRSTGVHGRLDLRGIEQDWIADGIKSWLTEAPRGHRTATQLVRAWDVAGQALSLRGTPVHLLGDADMSAVMAAIRKRWPTANAQRRSISSINLLLTYARHREQLGDTWGAIPAQFAVDRSRHRPNGLPRSSETGDEPFRFVPQPVIEHLMGNLNLLRRSGEYLTAEARAMLYVHERCGRRTSETIKMLDDCISYDNEGAPYLEWVRGKPPYTKGKRLPIHQETHDVIRQWQQIKREHGVSSIYLFPNRERNSTTDRPWNASYLGHRLKELIAVVEQHAPVLGPVVGSEGNLIEFDLRSLDPYSFRHAFAQRFADATDADGRPTTPPDVLQDLMGHATFETTMAYYEVSTRRRKRALSAVAPRRLNLHGAAVSIDRERDGFTKVAVSLGHCSEPQNVAQHGHGCMIDHSCESCPFFLVDPLERDGMDAKRHHIRVQLERARAINAQQHLLDHYEARIRNWTTMIDGIDRYVDGLPTAERDSIRAALTSMAEIRRLASAPRSIDLRAMFDQEETR